MIELKQIKIALRGETIEKLIDFIDIAFQLKLPPFARCFRALKNIAIVFDIFPPSSVRARKLCKKTQFFLTISIMLLSEIICHYVEDY